MHPDGQTVQGVHGAAMMSWLGLTYRCTPCPRCGRVIKGRARSPRGKGWTRIFAESNRKRHVRSQHGRRGARRGPHRMMNRTLDEFGGGRHA